MTFIYVSNFASAAALRQLSKVEFIFAVSLFWASAKEEIRNSIENINGFGALNEIVSAAESGDVVSRIWLEKTKAEVYEEGLTDDQLSFRVMKKVEEQGVSVEKAGEKSIFVIKNCKEGSGASKEVAIIDASGDVEEMISEGDRGSRVISKEIQTLLNLIGQDGIKSILDTYRTLTKEKRLPKRK